jgi:hypothetical protein
MRRIYSHEGFEIVIELEETGHAVISGSAAMPEGYLATMYISMTDPLLAMVGPIRFGAEQSRPFPTQAEALMTTFSAGQRLVDDIFMRR